MQNRRWVALSHLLALVSMSTLCYLAAPLHHTSLSSSSARALGAKVNNELPDGSGTRRQRLSREKRLASDNHAKLATVEHRQSLLFDTVTLGPYGSYDAATWHIGDVDHPWGRGPDVAEDPTMYQTATLSHANVPGVAEDADDTMYQTQSIYAGEMKGKPQSLARSRLAKTALRWEAGPERRRGQGLADAGYVYQTEWIHNPLAPKGDELVPYDEADVMHQVLWRSLSVSIFSVCPLCSH